MVTNSHIATWPMTWPKAEKSKSGMLRTTSHRLVPVLGSSMTTCVHPSSSIWGPVRHNTPKLQQSSSPWSCQPNMELKTTSKHEINLSQDTTFRCAGRRFVDSHASQAQTKHVNLGPTPTRRNLGATHSAQVLFLVLRTTTTQRLGKEKCNRPRQSTPRLGPACLTNGKPFTAFRLVLWFSQSVTFPLLLQAHKTGTVAEFHFCFFYLSRNLNRTLARKTKLQQEQKETREMENT